MKLETSIISLGAHRISESGKQSFLQSSRADYKQKISEQQKSYLEKIKSQMTIEEIIKEALQKAEEFSFREIFDLVEKLVDLNVITDQNIRKYFEDDQEIEEKEVLKFAPVEGAEEIVHWKPQDIATLPFFRNLKEETLHAFIDQCRIQVVPERTLVVKNENTDRDMYVILEGEASIYRLDPLKRRRLITSIPAGSVFGEGAFFLNRPRTADVITNIKTIIARIEYSDKKFSHFINSTHTPFIQERLWVLHGLLSSPLFHHLPTETMDHFLLMGKTKKVGINEVVCSQGKQGNSFYVLIQGKCNVFRDLSLLRTLKQGDFFGEIALLINQGDRVATVQSVTECLLLEIERDEFYKVLSQNLFLAKEIEEIAHKRYDHIFK